MTTFQIVFAASLLVVLALGLFVFALWRHKRAGSGDLDLMGASASVETTLGPEGSVLVRGELWPARSSTGASLERGRAVRVVGASRHLLMVAPLRVNSSE
ncbi:MAG TPA: NfeD family protein [Pyrinomonadaceae bacterium]|nr:NfeD family protein [Pyrinomonadaceae bacterium]